MQDVTRILNECMSSTKPERHVCETTLGEGRNDTAMTAFSRTFAQLLADRAGTTPWVVAGAVLILGGWLCWAVWARISLYEVSHDARLEVDSATYPIESPFLGRVVQCHLQVGQSVHQGNLLIELDTMPDRLALNQETVRKQALGPELARLRSQIAAERQAETEEQKSAHLRLQEGRDRVREAEIAAEYSERELLRVRKLHHEQLLPDRDLEKAEAEAAKLRASVATLQSAADRIPQEQSTRERESEVRLQRLQKEMAELEGVEGTETAAIERLDYEIERRRIRAPADGRIAEAATLRLGAVVDEGEKLGSIVSAGRLQVVAQYPAEAAFGRIRTGQVGTLRLDGFPWAEFGTVSATVTRVAQDVRDGRVRVELAVNSGSNFRGKLQHGMPGSLEIIVERLSPLALIARTAGQWLTAQQ